MTNNNYVLLPMRLQIMHAVTYNTVRPLMNIKNKNGTPSNLMEQEFSTLNNILMMVSKNRFDPLKGLVTNRVWLHLLAMF